MYGGGFDDNLFGPIVLSPRLKVATYLAFLTSILIYSMTFCYALLRLFFLSICDFSHTRFSLRRIGRNGPVHWPARSPDMYPLDFFIGDI